MRSWSTKRHRAGAACALVVLAAGQTLLADPQFSFLDLGTLGGVRSEAHDINNSGIVVGWSRNAANAVRAFITAPNTAINPATDALTPFAGGTYSAAYAVNSSGQVVGDSGSSSGDRAYRYSGGVMTNLGTLGGDWSYASGINALGHVAGSAAVKKNLGPTHAFLYNGTSKFDLGELSNSSDSYASAINSSGKVVGYGVDTGWLDHAFLWTPTVPNGTTGTMVDIGTLGGSSSYAWSINDSNAIVGGSNTAGDLGYHAFRYTAGSWTDLGTLGGVSSEAFDINASGNIVGQADIAGNLSRAFLYSGGTMYNLNTLLGSAAPGWTLTSARAINDNGQIVGYGVAPDGQTRAFLLTPEPAWKNDADGVWSASTNWNVGVPNAVGSVANFGSAIQSPRTVTVDAPQTVGRINFNNSFSYTVAGGGTLTLDVSSGSAQINVAAGSHTISAPLQLQDNTTIDVTPAASVLTMNGNMTAAAGVNLLKQGAGTAVVNHIRAHSVNVTGGKLKVAPNGGDGGVSVVRSIAASTGGQIDITNNAVIVKNTPTGSWNGSAYTGLAGLVQSGRNEGDWNGTGIITSMTDATSGVLGAVAVASVDEAGLVGEVFRGQTLGSGDSIVLYTWGGDADLNGLLNGDDYFFIDSNIVQSGLVFGFSSGDFNYDGVIDGDDYFIIDSNMPSAPGEGSSFAMAGGGLSAVPEPASLIAGGIFAAGALVRRRRR